jgi:hypothetical protein
MGSGWVVWIRKYWVIPIVVVYLLGHLLVWRARGPSYAVVAPPWSLRGWTLVDFPMFVGIFLGMRLLLTGRRRGLGIAMAVASLLVQGILAYSNFSIASTTSSLNEFGNTRITSNPRFARLPERAMEHDKGRGGQRAARFWFRETGKPIPFRDDAGETHTFEPTAEDAAAWEHTRRYNAALDRLRPQFEAIVVTYRLKAYAFLFLGGLAVVLALALPWRRQPGG